MYIQKGQKVSQETQEPGETEEEEVQVDFWEDLALKDPRVLKVNRWVCIFAINMEVMET